MKTMNCGITWIVNIAAVCLESVHLLSQTFDNRLILVNCDVHIILFFSSQGQLGFTAQFELHKDDIVSPAAIGRKRAFPQNLLQQIQKHTRQRHIWPSTNTRKGDKLERYLSFQMAVRVMIYSSVLFFFFSVKKERAKCGGNVQTSLDQSRNVMPGVKVL